MLQQLNREAQGCSAAGEVPLTILNTPLVIGSSSGSAAVTARSSMARGRVLAAFSRPGKLQGRWVGRHKTMLKQRAPEEPGARGS
jgi:hypothetical protein